MPQSRIDSNLTEVVIEEDQELANAVSKIILSGININFNSWKRADLINLKNVSSVLNKLGGINYLVDKKLFLMLKYGVLAHIRFTM